MCALTGDEVANEIPDQASYEVDVSDVYRPVASMILRKSGNLDISSVSPRFEGGDPHSLPSWVPDWTCKSTLVAHFGLTDDAEDGCRDSTNSLSRIGKLWRHP